MIVAFGQNERRAAALHCLNKVFADQAIASLVAGQLLIESVKLSSYIGIGRFQPSKRRRTNHDRVVKGSRRGLRLGTYFMSNRPTLHRYDRMMAILSHDRGLHT